MQSKTYQIEALQHKLHVKEVLLRESDISKNDAKDILEDMKVEMERFGKRITKQLFKLKDPPLNEVIVPMKRADSLESVSVMPNSTSGDSRSECSDQEETIPMEMRIDWRYQYEHKDSDIESDQASSIQSVQTVVSNHIRVDNLDGTLQSTATSKHSAEDIPAIKVEPLHVQPTINWTTQTCDKISDELTTQSDTNSSDELATQSDTNSSALFTQPVPVQSPSGSELSDAEAVKSKSSRHTKELVAPTQRKQRSAELKEPSTSAGYETKENL